LPPFFIHNGTSKAKGPFDSCACYWRCKLIEGHQCKDWIAMMIMLPLTKDFDAAFSERFNEVTVQLALYPRVVNNGVVKLKLSQLSVRSMLSARYLVVVVDKILMTLLILIEALRDYTLCLNNPA
jgi:hypothetical protein